MSHSTNSQTLTLILEDSSLASGQVWDFIDKAMVKQSIKLRRFLPRRALENASQRQIVFRVIKEDSGLDGVVTSAEEKEEFAEDVFKNARKLFLACIYCNLPMRCLWMFWKRSITDEKLPLGEKECPEDYKREYNSAFLSSQHLFLAPSFEPGRSWNFTYDEIIPLSYSESKRCGKGGFGSVYPVTIHPDHHTLHPTMNDFAIKVFDNRALVNSATGYLRERGVQMGIAGVDHKHLVKMLTSFTYEGNYYMIFPFANCDLWDYMEKNPKFPYNDPKKISWLITQMVGLAEALEKIHRPGNVPRFGQHLDTNLAAVDVDSTAYHHDIKHDNILLFIEDDCREVILCLSDFGCGKVTTLLLNAAGKKESHRTPTKGNPTFGAPEGFSGSTSRPYDIWSIACVFLELLVWAVQGFPKISQFEQNRSSPVSQERPTEDDRFYHLERDGKIYLKQAVQDKISELKGLTKDNEVLHQLLEVLVKLFVIEPEKRPKAPDLVKMLQPLKSLAEKKLRSSDKPISESMVTAVSPSVQRSHDNIPEVRITEAKL